MKIDIGSRLFSADFNRGIAKFEEHIDKKLIRRIYLFIIIVLVMTMVLVYDVILSDVSIFLVILGLSIGFAIGTIVSRVFSVKWHTREKKVISRLDLIGGIVLMLYITLSIFRHWIFEHWFKGAKLSIFTVSFIEGVIIGRILGLYFSIRRILSKQGKI